MSLPCVGRVATTATTTRSPGRGLLWLSGSVAAAVGQAGWVWRERRVKMGGKDGAALLPWWSPVVMLPQEQRQHHQARESQRDPLPDSHTRRDARPRQASLPPALLTSRSWYHLPLRPSVPAAQGHNASLAPP